MEETIQTEVAPEQVWREWERAHALRGQGAIEEGQKGKSQFRYQVLDVKKGESFSMLWKTFFVRLIFTQAVRPHPRGSEISYKVQIKGPFAWAVRRFLGAKIKKNITYVLRTVVAHLEGA